MMQPWRSHHFAAPARATADFRGTTLLGRGIAKVLSAGFISVDNVICYATFATKHLHPHLKDPRL